jgi:hypothetical protein
LVEMDYNLLILKQLNLILWSTYKLIRASLASCILIHWRLKLWYQLIIQILEDSGISVRHDFQTGSHFYVSVLVVRYLKFEQEPFLTPFVLMMH